MKTIIVNELNDKNSLIHNKKYHVANEEADKAEKNKYPKGYEQLKKLEGKLKPHELMGKIEGNKVAVEAKFKNHAKEITMHDEIEKKIIAGGYNGKIDN